MDNFTELYEIDESSAMPIWLQLKNRIVYLISSGYYKAGDKLPTVRELAVKIGINYNTVNKVYMSLLHDGYLISRRGQGTFVNKLARPAELVEDSPADNIIDFMINQCLEIGVPLDDVVNQVSKRVERRRGLDAAEKGSE